MKKEGYEQQVGLKARKVIIVVFLLGALLASIVFLSLIVAGFPALAPRIASERVIISGGGEGQTFLPYFNYSSSSSYPYHNGVMALGGGFKLNQTSLISGTLSSTSGIDLFFFSLNNTSYLLEPSFNGTGTMYPGSYVYTTGSVISARVGVVLPAGTYGFVLLNPSPIPSNVTSATRIIATPY